MKKYIYKFLLIITLFTLIIFSITGCTTIKAVNTIKAGEIQLANNIEREISVEKSAHALIIKTHINESDKEYNFILDTGALTSISKKVAKEIGVDKGIKIIGKDSAGNKKNISLVQLDSIAVEDIKVKQCAAAIIDLSEIDPNIDGILGSNFLRFFKVTIDYQTQKVIFSNNNNPTEIYENTLQIPFQQEFKYGYAPVITCSIEDTISAKCIIDTGASYLAGIPLSIMKKTKAFKNGNVIEAKGNMSGGAFGTDKKSFILLADKLNIGGFVITGAPLFSNNTEDEKAIHLKTI
ncbi:MAG: clan AA aspartic protease [Deltaproteobacteria bacterium]|nr:clan AA aspartic protease [Deltaproteobacteria bacterium]